MTSTQQHIAHIQQLQSPNPVEVYDALRTIKNAIIGSNSKKGLYFRLQIIPHISSLLELEDTDVQIRIQATAIISSLAHKDEDAAKQLLDEGVMGPLITQIIPGTDPVLMEASERALNALLGYTSTRISAEEHTSMIIPYLLSIITEAKVSPRMYEMRVHARVELAVLILGKLCVTEARQFMVANTGAIDLLVPLLLRGYPRLQIATLQAFSALSYENMEICRALITVSHKDRPFSAIVLELVRHQDPAIRLHACLCLSNLSRMRVAGGVAQDIQNIGAPALVKLLHCTEVDRLQVIQALGYLCHEDADIQLAAKGAGAISDLIQILTDIEGQEDDDFVDHEHNILTIKAIFLTLGTIVSVGEDCRAKAAENKILAHLVRAMGHRDNGVKAAACLCTQYIVRSVPICRTHVPESGLLKPLLGLVRHATPDVQVTATAALINLLPEFSPLRFEALKEGLIDTLVQFFSAEHLLIRRNALWCVRSLLCKISDETRMEIIDKVDVERLFNLLHPDEELLIREQAAGVMQNITGENDIGAPIIFERLGPERLVELLKRMLSPRANTAIHIHGLYLANNMAVSSELYCDPIIKDRDLIQSIVDYATSSVSEVSIGSLWCITNLASHKKPSEPDAEDAEEPRYLLELTELGVQSMLENMLSDSTLCLGVRDRVKGCLDCFTPPEA
ncbi:hypothetical protein H4R24_005306 [Coemansia sp. RSA 988]|nr:hypothetical protein H4R24_005306 [Coemansia sp. RSA 988]